MSEVEKKYTREDYSALVKKGGRWLTEYLAEDASARKDLTQEYLRVTIRTIREEYRRLMHDEQDFFEKVELFCGDRRFKREKDEFFYGVVKDTLRSGRVYDTLEERIPGYISPLKRRARG